MQALLDHLLKTLAAVPVGSRVLDLGCGAGRRVRPLLRLGFDVHACDARPEAVEAARQHAADAAGPKGARARIAAAAPHALPYPEASFDWVVAFGVLGVAEGARSPEAVLSEVRRVLRPGGWVYVAARRLTEDELERGMQRAGLAEAEAPARVEEGAETLLRAVYRRVDAGTPA